MLPLSSQVEDLDELRARLLAARVARQPFVDFALPRFQRVTAHVPEDLTVRVEAGLTLQTLQEQLSLRRQWLPVDPPHPGRRTIGGVVAGDFSGPRRFGYGTIREHLLGMAVLLADGKLIHSGGQVVKNVAGYDLLKLFVGSRGTLGIIVEATFKLRPLPLVEKVVQTFCKTLAEATAVREKIFMGELAPIVLDLHNLLPGKGLSLVTAFAGRPEEVDWQLGALQKIAPFEPADFGYESKFWEGAPPATLSVLPSETISWIERLQPAEFVARLGNGVMYHRDSRKIEQPVFRVPRELFQRIKAAYDPDQVFPNLSS